MVFPIVFFARRIFLPFTQSRIYWQSCLQNLTVICKYVFNRDKKPLFRVIHYVSLLFFKFRKLVNIVHVVLYLPLHRDFTFCLDNKGQCRSVLLGQCFCTFSSTNKLSKVGTYVIKTNILFFIIENHSIFFPKKS